MSAEPLKVFFPNNSYIYVSLHHSHISKNNLIVILTCYHLKYNVFNKTDMRQKTKKRKKKSTALGS